MSFPSVELVLLGRAMAIYMTDRVICLFWATLYLRKDDGSISSVEVCVVIKGSIVCTYYGLYIIYFIVTIPPVELVLLCRLTL